MSDQPYDAVVTLIRKKDGDCLVCDTLEKSVEKMGEDQHVHFIEVQLESEFEQKLARVLDGAPKVYMDLPDE